LIVWKRWATYTETDHEHITQMVKLIEMLNWESLFILSWLSTRQSIMPSAGVNPQGRSAGKVKLLLNDTHPEPQGVRPQHHRGGDDLE
jgi:hypothetical protein